MALGVIATSIGGSTTTTTSWTGNLTSVSAGCMTVVVFTSRDHTGANGQPSITDSAGGAGWSHIFSSADRKSHLFAKLWSGSHSGTVTVSGGIGSCAGVVATISDAGTITKLADSSLASGTETTAGVTAPTAGSLIFGSIHNTANDNSVSSHAWATLGAVTGSNQHLSTGGSDCATHLGYRQEGGGPAATGAMSWAQTNGTTQTIQFSIAPAATNVSHTVPLQTFANAIPTVVPQVGSTHTLTPLALLLAQLPVDAQVTSPDVAVSVALQNFLLGQRTTAPTGGASVTVPLQGILLPLQGVQTQIGSSLPVSLQNLVLGVPVTSQTTGSVMAVEVQSISLATEPHVLQISVSSAVELQNIDLTQLALLSAGGLTEDVLVDVGVQRVVLLLNNGWPMGMFLVRKQPYNISWERVNDRL